MSTTTWDALLVNKADRLKALPVQDLSFAASKGMAGAHQKLMAAQRSSRAESLPNYYAVLGVDKSASPAAIRTAFR